MTINSNLTVIICNYNHGKYLSNLIESILSQSLKPEKIIIIDDGSIDNSHSLLKNYQNKDLFKIILNNTNKGVIFRMNQGLNLVDTEYFMVYGADDKILNKKAFEISIDCLNHNPNAGLSSALVAKLRDDYEIESIIKTPIVSKKIKYLSPKESLKEMEKYGLYINGHLTIVRTKCFKETISLYPDLDQMTDIAAFYVVAINFGTIFIPRIFGGYRFQESKGYAANKFLNKTKTYKNILKMLRVIEDKNYKNFNLSKLYKIIKLNYKLFYFRMDLKPSEKKNIFINILLNIKFYLYFYCIDKSYFLRYLKYKMQFIYFNEKK